MEQKLPKRSEVAVEQTWKLEDVYPDVQAFEEDLKRGLVLADEIDNSAADGAAKEWNINGEKVTLAVKAYKP